MPSIIPVRRNVLHRAAPAVVVAAYQGQGDVVSGAAFYFGLRSYTAALAGTISIANVWRSSDGTTKDIKASALTGWLDTSDVFFNGSTSYAVTRLYDQTGNGFGVDSIYPLTFNSADAPTLLLNSLNGHPVIFFPAGTGHDTGFFSSNTFGSTFSQTSPLLMSAFVRFDDAVTASQTVIDFGNGVFSWLYGGGGNFSMFTGSGGFAWSATDSHFHSAQAFMNSTANTFANDAGVSMVDGGAATFAGVGNFGTRNLTTRPLGIAMGTSGGHEPNPGYAISYGLWPSSTNSVTYLAQMSALYNNDLTSIGGTW